MQDCRGRGDTVCWRLLKGLTRVTRPLTILVDYCPGMAVRHTVECVSHQEPNKGGKVWRTWPDYL